MKLKQKYLRMLRQRCDHVVFIRNVFKISVFVLFFAFHVSVDQSVAGIVFDEGSRGDLSDLPTMPTEIDINIGSNIVKGATRVGNTGSWDADFFLMNIKRPWKIEKVILREYMQEAKTIYEMPNRLGDAGAFLAVERGRIFSDPDTGANLLGAALIGVKPGRRIGDDLMLALGTNSEYDVEGFDSSLQSGEYTFWYQQTRGDTKYTLDVVVTPLPASAYMFGAATVGLFFWRRRRLAPPPKR